MFELFFDAGKNGDTISCGLVLKEGKTLICKKGYKLQGKKITNNTAEFIALIHGMLLALSHDITRLTVYGDSKGVIDQMSGRVQPKAMGMKYCHEVAKEIAGRFEKINFVWIKREMNKQADRETR